jgi:hypothetical protein
MSLFKKPSDPVGITFMLRGEAGSGKTRFALGAKRITGKPVAYIGNDRGAKFYQNDADVGGFQAIETSDLVVIDQALAELEKDGGRSFGALVLDTVTDLWNATQGKYEKPGKDGGRGVPMRAWRPLREEHETRLRRAQAMPMHVFLICEEKVIYERHGDDVREVGSREDADKKDSYVSDVRLRFYLDGKRFLAEVLKDRTGTFPMGHVLENPRVEMWAGALGSLPLDSEWMKKADDLVARVAKIANLNEYRSWRKKHEPDLEVLKKRGPSPAYERVKDALVAKHAALTAAEPSDGEPPADVQTSQMTGAL